MAFAKILNSGNVDFVLVDLGMYNNTTVYTDKIYIRKTHLVTLGMGANVSFVELIFNTGNKYQLTGNALDAGKFMYIDEVLGVAVTDNEDLLSKIFALL